MNKKKILIVEDEVSLLALLQQKLEKEGFVVSTAKNGQEGLKVAILEHPDLILLDIVMPVMDGITMLTELRENPWGKSVPVLIMTNLTDREKMAVGVKLDVKNYLVKSDWKLKDLIEKVKENVKNE